jgi:hypothetical protein
VLLICLLLGVPAALAISTYNPTTLSDAGSILGDGKIVVLEPEKWIGKRFPLLDHIETSENLKDGKWLVLLYHHDCPRCQEAIRDLARITRDVGLHKVALVESPPYGNGKEELGFPGITVIHRRLADNREWFVVSPVGLLLDKGVVFDIRQDVWFLRQNPSRVERDNSASASRLGAVLSNGVRADQQGF